jgi:hypothetical protein
MVSSNSDKESDIQYLAFCGHALWQKMKRPSGIRTAKVIAVGIQTSQLYRKAEGSSGSLNRRDRAGRLVTWYARNLRLVSSRVRVLVAVMRVRAALRVAVFNSNAGECVRECGSADQRTEGSDPRRTWEAVAFIRQQESQFRHNPPGTFHPMSCHTLAVHVTLDGANP